MTRAEAIAILVTNAPPEVLAAAIIDAVTPAGAEDEWDSETIELVLTPLQTLLTPLFPVTFNAAEGETAFWEAIAESH